MAQRSSIVDKTQRDHSIDTYRAKRDFTVTAEPAPGKPRAAAANAPIFVVQKHAAHRAGLHYDFRLEHNGVLWSWAVRKGPSLDPSVKHIAAHVEDHPIDYAGFQGSIPDGQYGAGTVETWDRGTWEPVNDPEHGMQKGELTFTLHGTRLNGRFHLVRLKPKPGSRSKADNWLLFKGHDEFERADADADVIEQTAAPPKPQQTDTAELAKYGKVKPAPASTKDAPASKEAAVTNDATKYDPATKGTRATKNAAATKDAPSSKNTAANKSPASIKSAPAPGAKRAKLPATQSPQLCAIADEPPDGGHWISEIKFDGYRLLALLDHGKVRLVTRNGHDWTDRLPAVAAAIARLNVETALLDGELVALDDQGISSFPALQAALSAGKDATLHLFLFDLLHLNGWDLTGCALLERKRVLQGIDDWRGMLRYSDHHTGDPAAMRREACRMKLEGIVCKQADAPYRPGRGHGWLKVKCQGREEFVVLGWTPPRGSRTGLGALHLGYYDEQGRLHYAGGVGTGFSDDELSTMRDRLDALTADPPRGLMVAGDPLDNTIHWVRPELVVEIQFVSWSGSGRVRHAVYLGLREDKSAPEVVRDVANPEAEHKPVNPRQPAGPLGGPIIAVPPKRGPAVEMPPQRGPKVAVPTQRGPTVEVPTQRGPAVVVPAKRGPKVAVPPKQGPKYAAAAKTSTSIVTARKPKARAASIEGVNVTHPDRELWPDVTKQDLAEYWQALAPHALSGLAHRPLAIVRCPEGIAGEHFFQKHGHGALPDGIRSGEAAGAPYLAIDDLHGLVAMAQISAIELHAWGASEADPLHPDFMVFDLDPGDGVTFAEVVRAALDLREKLRQLKLESFCRTTGGKGLHIVVPLEPVAGWDAVKAFCRAFAELLSEEQPDRFLSTVKKADRRGRILIDWLRNGLGATAVASFCPRARPGAGVATPLAWDEVTQSLDPATFTLHSVPDRLARQKADPWKGFAQLRQHLPDVAANPAPGEAKRPAPQGKSSGRSVIVAARKPKRRA
jgi:bifunctional non-homologous end joining protein LigD